MVSALWKASAAGDLTTVHDLLKDATSVDLEVKDHNGVTPLIEAVRNGHVEVVTALLAKGAYPTNASSQGPPETYTSDPSILELLCQAQSKASSRSSTDGPTFSQDTNQAQDKRYQYGQSPPVAYTYYPNIGSAPPAEGGAYYPVLAAQNAGENTVPGGVGNLPPPDIARFIPCRFFPACRYGPSCLFAHPQQYYPGSLPPQTQYVAPYDPMQSYPPNYFPPPPFQSPNGVHPMAAMLPPSGHSVHGPSPAEVALPVQPPFSPNALSPVSYGPLSPSAYPHPGQPPLPMMISPLPPAQHQAVLPTQSPSNMYNTAPTSAAYIQQHSGNSPYPISKSAVGPQESSGDLKPPHPQDGPGSNNHHPSQRDGTGHQRRGGLRGGSLSSRKPPCLFFPAGRCKNGDDCRYPHVQPEGNGTHASYFSARGSKPRPSNGNGVALITDKVSNIVTRDDASVPQNSNEGVRPQSTDTNRPRFHQGGKNGYVHNGIRPDKRPLPPKQRVPNADEFPVLAGSVTPPTRAPGANGVFNGNGLTGPTAAQVLQAPPPFRKDTSKEPSTRGTTPDSIKSVGPKVESNGVILEIVPATTHDQRSVKLPISFAAVAAPEIPKEIALSA